MTQTAQQAAFDPAAPAAERADALTQLHRQAMPTESSLLPRDAVREVIDYINGQYEEQAMLKAMQGARGVDFPSRSARDGEPGMQSVRLDEFQLSMQGYYWERPGVLGFDAMRAMVAQTPVLNAVINTRVRQVLRFARVAEDNQDSPGFEIKHLDRMHQLSESESEAAKLMSRFFMNCGWEFNPRRRKALRRDSFAQFLVKVTRDTLTMDSVGIETEWKRDRSLGFDGFYAVDGATIRLCTEDGYKGDPDVFALQVVQGKECTAYTFDDLIYEPRNPRSDVTACGYGLPETEQLIRVVTGFLNAMTYNIKGFDSNAIPKGMLHLTGNYSQQDIDAFKRYWNAMVMGVSNVWKLPVMVSKDQESRAAFEKFGVEFNEMYFAKWMTFLTSIICAIYGMSPAEINFDSFTGGSTSALSGSDTAEKLAASKDSGLRPVLAYFENLFTDFLMSEFSDSLCFRWTGLDPADQDKKHEMRKLVLTVNEVRAEEGYQAMPGPIGDAPMNSSLLGPWMQLTQQQQPQPDFGQAGGGGQSDTVQPEGGAQPPGAAGGDAEAQGGAGADGGGQAGAQAAPADGDQTQGGEQAQGGEQGAKQGNPQPPEDQPDNDKGEDFGKAMPPVYVIA